MTDITVEALKLRRREIEINIAMHQGALEEIDNIIREMERRRGGRPRKVVVEVVNGPEGLPGAAWHTPTDDGEAAE